MTSDAFDRRLDPSSSAPLAVGFSGGGDSLALLLRTLAWAGAHGRRVLALSVDHDLHPDSAAWTARAGDQAHQLGAEWRGLMWTGPKPTAGIQARARTARHGLLAEAARAAGARVILLGHTADDIAEGEVMRAGDTPGLGRLREWSPSPAWPEGRGLFLFRPLLRVARAVLRAELSARGEAWFDDPANEDLRYARVRARRTLAGQVGSGAPTELDPAIPALARLARFDAEGALLSRQALVAASPASARTTLSAALLCVSGTRRPPRGAELDRLLATIAQAGVATLAGCRVSAMGEDVRIVRAPPRRGESQTPPEPIGSARDRFAAACGLIENEAALADQRPPQAG